MRLSRFPLAVTWLLLAFFYLPIAVVVVRAGASCLRTTRAG